jgi:pimeloyl-ACP methyl ester carboxylesterase
MSCGPPPERVAAVRTTLVSIPAGATTLDGAYYEPAEGAAVRGAALLMHGNGGNFYTGPCRFLPPRLTPQGLACLSYNRQGHDTVSCRSRAAEGNAFQTTRQAMADNEHASEYLAGRGFPGPVVIGHSNGGLLAAAHAAWHPGTPALVLLSAHCGGHEMLERASRLGLLGRSELSRLSEQARALVASGRGGELMLMPGWWYVTTAASFVDMEQNLPHLLDLAPAIRCPVLFLVGEQEDRDLYPAEQFAGKAAGPAEVRIIPGADHFYAGHEDEVGRIVARWLRDVACGPGPV